MSHPAEISSVDGDDDLGAGLVQIRLPDKLKVSPVSLVGGVGFSASDDECLIVLESFREKQSCDQFRAGGEFDFLLHATMSQNTASNMSVNLIAKQ